MKPVLLIGDSSINDSPYIGSYLDIFERNNIPYELVYWNRHLDETTNLPNNFISYNRFTDNKYPSWKRLIKIWGYTRFAKRIMQRNDYSCVIVFTIANAVFLYPTLKKKYKKNYIFDIRDYSPICKVSLLRGVINGLIEHSSFTVVSSEGFLRWLPKGYKCHYIKTHNTSKSIVDKYYDNDSVSHRYMNGVISILTIGQIRDYSANSILLSKLKNNTQFKMVFSGSGIASDKLKEYAVSHHIKNVQFTGRYKKEEEENIVLSNQMINAYLNHNINSETLMSNRFYLSVLMRKPIIVNKGSFQAEIVNQYGLGVILDDNDDFSERIKEWWYNLDLDKYNDQCKEFLDKVKADLDNFEGEVVKLLHDSLNQ